MKKKNKSIKELYEKSPDVRERIRKDVDFSQFEKKNAPAANRQTDSSGRRQSCPLRLSR